MRARGGDSGGGGERRFLQKGSLSFCHGSGVIKTKWR